MFNFKKKEKLSEEEKNIIKQILLFYNMHNNIFTEISSAKEKREIIKKIYEILDYNSVPKLFSTLDLSIQDELFLYRGISANNIEELTKYVNQFLHGEIFYGGRASIYGTGIYTVIGKDSNVAYKYASDGETNNCGIVIESRLQKDSRIIKSNDVESIRNFIFEKLRKMYKQDIEAFLSVLEDDGAIAAILGYDAIYVEEKEYIVVLNRSKMIVNDFEIFDKLNHINDIKNR